MLRIIDITGPDISNGEGIRTTLWVAGCTHHCKGCHNQWTWNYNQGRECSDPEQLNRILNILEENLSKEYMTGLTISGGDPLCQDDEGLQQLLDIIGWMLTHFGDKDIWLYTGYTLEYIREHGNELQNKIIDSIDVLVDGPYEEDKRDLVNCPFRGSYNQRIHKFIKQC